jgi:hypothetical protein
MFVLGYFLLGIRFNFSKIFKLPNSHQEIQKHITFVLDLSQKKKSTVDEHAKFGQLGHAGHRKSKRAASACQMAC